MITEKDLSLFFIFIKEFLKLFSRSIIEKIIIKYGQKNKNVRVDKYKNNLKIFLFCDCLPRILFRISPLIDST